MSDRPHDPFAPGANWPNTAVAVPSDDTPVVPVEELLGLEPLTGDAAPRDTPPVPAPEPAQKPTKPRRGRRARKDQPVALEDALARLDAEEA